MGIELTQRRQGARVIARFNRSSRATLAIWNPLTNNGRTDHIRRIHEVDIRGTPNESASEA